MEITLSENIRAFRKERRLTQEQLAEVLGVTTGAVYKWESGISVPELSLIVELADFFDVSVDALLGYRMKDNGEAATVRRLGEYCRGRSAEALTEAEKALKKYPNSFEVVYICAEIYLVYGAEGRKKEVLCRALELLEQSRRLISQNRDPELSELHIYGEIASAYDCLGESDKCLEILKKNNAHGVFNDIIGLDLAVFLDRPGEAEPYLLKAMMAGAGMLINTVFGYAFVFLSRGDTASAREILTLGITLLRGIKKEGEAPDFFDKICAELYVLMAHIQLAGGDDDGAAASIECAARHAERFDAEPDYGVSSFRYARIPDTVSLYDKMGATASEGIANLIKTLGNEKLSAKWKEAAENG